MLKSGFELEQIRDCDCEENSLPVTFCPSFYQVKEKLKRWAIRFSHADDSSIFSDLLIFYLISSKKFLDHREHVHFFRLVLSIHFMQKKLYRSATFLPNQRSLEIRWLPTTLHFPFSSKSVLGCLIGFNVMDRYELFDEENILLTLQKYLPELHLVKDSSYCHASQHKNLKLFYLEIEKKDGLPFSLQEQKILKQNLEEKVKNTIQILSPAIFMTHNEEEVYKNILVLSQEIRSLQTIPQAYITFEGQTGKEIVFLITLVYTSPLQGFALNKHFPEGAFVSERTVTVKKLKNQPVEANIFRIHMHRDASLLRSDGSLDFYSARQKAAALIKGAIGEFRDYNGGIIIKRQELLHGFKELFPEITKYDPELIESFFYAITPIVKQVVLELDVLCKLFTYFLENRKHELASGATFAFKTYRQARHIFLVVHWKHFSFKDVISTVLKEQAFEKEDIAYNFLETEEGTFFTCFVQSGITKAEPFIIALQKVLDERHKKMLGQQVLRIGMDYSAVSLDPRIGGAIPSIDIIRLLFEGLTRFNQLGEVENAIAESIEISSDLKHYTFKLRPSFWSDGSPVSAFDFEYAWKKILSVSFKTAYAYLFYPIKNAKEAKEGFVSPDEIGIHVQDALTLKVELSHPTPYFLQLTSYPLYSPIHRTIDQQHPEWPYQSEKNYPCNGPFQLKINRPNQGFQLVKNPYYKDSCHIHMDEVLFTFMNPTQAIQAFNKKEIDWIGNPFGLWDSAYDANKESQTISIPDCRVCWCAFNVASAPFNHHKLRLAISYAIQRAQIVAGAFIPLNAAYAPLLPRDRDNTPPVFPEFDMEKARQLFHEALHELEIPKENFRISLLCGEMGLQKYTATCLKLQLQECFGIEIDLKPMLWGDQFKQMVAGSFEMGLVNWSSYIKDPIYTLDFFKSSKHVLNFSRWEHPEFQNLIEHSEQEVDPKKRLAYLLKAEQILGFDMPVIPLYYLPSQALVRKDLQLDNQSFSLPFNVSLSYYKPNNQGV